MKKALMIATLTAVLGSWLCPALTSADDIKSRMIKRLPVIDELLEKGITGESSSGLLEFRTDKKVKEDVVSAENADRKAVYDQIAKAQGTAAKLVGQRRAAQIASKAKPGTWLQKPSGEWYRK